MTVTDLPPLAAPAIEDPPSVVDGVLVHDSRFPHLRVTFACVCGGRRDEHRGRTHRGGCSGTVSRSDLPISGDSPTGVTHWAVPQLNTDMCTCTRYRRDPADLRVERALAALHEPLGDAMTRHDRRRRRSRKTARARAAGRWGIGPSDIGKCRKAIEYRERPPEDYEPGPEDRSAAVLGTWFHEGWTGLQRSLYPWREVKVAAHVPGFDEPGEIDAYDEILRLIIDLKTCGEYAWERIGEVGLREDDVDQAFLYGLALRAAGRPVERIMIEYVRRANGQAERFLLRYSEERALQAAGRLHAVIEGLDAGLPMPRDYAGPSLDGRCRSCPAVRHCWQIDAAEEIGRTPEGWMLARDDAKIATALDEYVRANEVERGAKETKKRVKVLVEGVEYGVYGDCTYRKTGGSSDWQPDERARAEQLADAMVEARERNEAPPDPASLPYPEVQVTSPRRVEIKRVRASQRQESG